MEEEKSVTKDKEKDESWWTRTFNKKKFTKPDRVGVIYLRNNGNVDLFQKETKNGFFSVGNETYHINRDCVYTLTKERIPLLIQREWDLIPLGTKKWDDEEMRDKHKQLETHVLKGIRNAELVKGGDGESSPMTLKQGILWGLGAIILIAVIMQAV